MSVFSSPRGPGVIFGVMICAALPDKGHRFSFTSFTSGLTVKKCKLLQYNGAFSGKRKLVSQHFQFVLSEIKRNPKGRRVQMSNWQHGRKLIQVAQAKYS